MVNGLAFLVTERCNFSCEYCDIPHISSPKDYDINSFLRYIDTINQYPLDFVTITGGEPGLLSALQVEILFKHIKHPINVNTNGEFIRNGYYDEYRSQIQLLDYHIVGPEVEFRPSGTVRYILVQHALNQDYIELMEMDNPEIDFTIYDYDDKLNKPEFIIKANLNPYHECHWPIKEIDWCNNRLVDCCSSPISSFSDPLTDRNLSMFMVVKYARKWHGCKYCTRQRDRFNA